MGKAEVAVFLGATLIAICLVALVVAFIAEVVEDIRSKAKAKNK